MGFSLGAKQHAANMRAIHPVDVIEQLAESYGWAFERAALDEISVVVAGNAADYDISFAWFAEHETLHLSCAFQLNAPPAKAAELQTLLSLVNEKLLFGHFDRWQKAGRVVYRQTLVLSGGLHPTDAQIKTMLLTALDACEAYYGSCRCVAGSDVSAAEALRHGLFETIGNA